jgi:diguanylate cyclase (GGDEF)-like protein/putative nucleotidyltransferase with HDIG domain
VHRRRLERDRAALIGELRRRSATDELTGCWNHGTFNDRLRREVDRALRYQHPLSLLVCDVDLLRDLNATYGHEGGDAALVDVGARLRSLSRSSDVVARIGGDEFVVLMPEAATAEAVVLARRIADVGAMENGNVPFATLSIGVAQLDLSNPTPRRLLRDADRAMYDAKALGRRTVVAAGQDAGRLEDSIGARSHAVSADRKRDAEVDGQERREAIETEMILDTLLGEAPVGFAFVDRDFRIVRINACLAAVNGGTVHDQVGRTVADVAPRLWPSLKPLYEGVLDSGDSLCNIEVTGPASEDGADDHAWLTSLYPVRVAERITGIGVVTVDITDRRRLERSQETLTDAVVSALAAAVEARDPYTAGHQLRVAEISQAVATELGYDDFTVKGIGLAAAIHDIGKVSIPAEILSKPGRLTKAEMELVKGHPEAGFQILRNTEFPWPVAEMVLQHHERLDGSGYPAGLRSDEICMGARVIAVADVVEAMAAHRPYRPALGIEAALATLLEGRDQLFDPDVVDACIGLFRKGILRAERHCAA